MRFPQLHKSAISPFNGIGPRQRHPFDGCKPCLTWISRTNVGMLTRWITAYNQEIVARAQPHMSGPRRQDQAVARTDFHLASGRSADQQARVPASNTQHFVGMCVIMLIRKHAVAPQSLPAVLPEAFLKLGRHVGMQGQCPAIDKHGQSRIVGDPITSLEQSAFDGHA